MRKWYSPDSRIQHRWKDYLPCIVCHVNLNFSQISKCFVYPTDKVNKNIVTVCNQCQEKAPLAPPKNYKQWETQATYYHQNLQIMKKLETTILELVRKRKKVLFDTIHATNYDIWQGEIQLKLKKEKFEKRKVELVELEDKVQELNQIYKSLETEENRLEDEIVEKKADIRRLVTSEMRNVGEIVNKYFTEMVNSAKKSLPDPENLPINLPTCSICKLEKVNSVATCGHTFCSQCICKIGSCPYCQHPIYTINRLYFT